MKRMNFPNRREQRRLDAAVRQDEYNKLTDEQKLEQLPGFCDRQRARLLKKNKSGKVKP